MIALAGLTASMMRFGTPAEQVFNTSGSIAISYGQLCLLIALVWPVFFRSEQLYDVDTLFWGSGELMRVARAISFGVLGLIVFEVALRLVEIARAWLILTWISAVLFDSIGRLVVRSVLRSLRHSGRLLRPTLIVGSNRDAEKVAAQLLKEPWSGIYLIGALASTRDELADLPPDLTWGVPYVGFARELQEVIRTSGADTLVVISSAFEHDVVSRIITELRGQSIDIHITSGLFEIMTSRVIVRETAGIPILMVRETSLSSAKLRTKRVFDVLVGSAILLIGMPMWLLVALAIKIDSRGPVFYRRERVGKDGRTFRMLKFRSMYMDADERLAALQGLNEQAGPLFKMRQDPRVTRVGRWLRRYSIDELPQVVNVLEGDMSLVGPRPPLVSEVAQYSSEHWRRLEVLPGMTGLWQVSGRSDLTFAEMMRLDLFYIENWTLRFDAAIMLRTVPAVLFGTGAY